MNTKPSDKTRVIFRKFEGEVIALFPELPGDSNFYATCLSYQHLGQHGSASVDLCAEGTTPATPAEYADLKKELESLGYILQVAFRCTRLDCAKRRDACRFEFTPAKG